MSIKIIGAGFPRTGTTTLKNVLEILGYTKTYHFKDLIGDPDRLTYWKELEHHGSTNFENLFDGFSATVDFPGYSYYKILLDKYPDAKIILTTRPFEDWYISSLNTIWKAGPQTLVAKLVLLTKMIFNSKLKKTFKCIKFMRQTHLNKKFDGNFASKSHAEKVYNDHIKEVSAYVPKERLLVYEVSQGWEPLCNFLDLDIPEIPFPHLNKKENFHKMVKGMIEEAAKK